MFISMILTPSDLISSIALLYVLSVVPKPGMVMPMTSVTGLPSDLTASTATSSASVESSPPLIPITQPFEPTCSILFARPAA